MHHIIYYCLGLGYALGVAVMNLPPALDALMEHYQVSYLRISILITSMLWPHTLIMLPGGIVADRISLVLCSSICLALIAGGNLIAMLFPSLEAAIVGRMVCGLGTGMLFVVTMKLTALHAPQGRAGTFQSLFGVSVSLGSITAFLIGDELAALHWSWAYGLPALAAGLVLLPAPWLKPNPRQAVLTGFAPMLVAARTRESWLLGLAHGVSWGTVIGLGNWTPSFYAESMGESGSVQYAWLGAVLMLITGLGRLVGGAIIIKIRPLKVIWLTMLLIGLGYGAFYALPIPMVVLCVSFLTLWFATINFGAIFQVASYAVEPSAMGSLMGLINFLANLAAIFIIMICGWFKEETGSFSGAFIYIALSGVLAAGLIKYLLPDKQE